MARGARLLRGLRRLASPNLYCTRSSASSVRAASRAFAARSCAASVWLGGSRASPAAARSAARRADAVSSSDAEAAASAARRRARRVAARRSAVAVSSAAAASAAERAAASSASRRRDRRADSSSAIRAAASAAERRRSAACRRLRGRARRVVRVAATGPQGRLELRDPGRRLRGPNVVPVRLLRGAPGYSAAPTAAVQRRRSCSRRGMARSRPSAARATGRPRRRSPSRWRLAFTAAASRRPAGARRPRERSVARRAPGQKLHFGPRKRRSKPEIEAARRPSTASKASAARGGRGGGGGRRNGRRAPRAAGRRRAACRRRAQRAAGCAEPPSGGIDACRWLADGGGGLAAPLLPPRAPSMSSLLLRPRRRTTPAAALGDALGENAAARKGFTSLKRTFRARGRGLAEGGSATAPRSWDQRLAEDWECADGACVAGMRRTAPDDWFPGPDARLMGATCRGDSHVPRGAETSRRHVREDLSGS